MDVVCESQMLKIEFPRIIFFCLCEELTWILLIFTKTLGQRITGNFVSLPNRIAKKIVDLARVLFSDTLLFSIQILDETIYSHRLNHDIVRPVLFRDFSLQVVISNNVIPRISAGCLFIFLNFRALIRKGRLYYCFDITSHSQA